VEADEQWQRKFNEGHVTSAEDKQDAPDPEELMDAPDPPDELIMDVPDPEELMDAAQELESNAPEENILSSDMEFPGHLEEGLHDQEAINQEDEVVEDTAPPHEEGEQTIDLAVVMAYFNGELESAPRPVLSEADGVDSACEDTGSEPGLDHHRQMARS
jgi:hypothetical protein